MYVMYYCCMRMDYRHVVYGKRFVVLTCMSVIMLTINLEVSYAEIQCPHEMKLQCSYWNVEVIESSAEAYLALIVGGLTGWSLRDRRRDTTKLDM